MKNYNGSYRTWVLQKAKCIPTAICFVAVGNFLELEEPPQFTQEGRRLQEVEWLVSHYNHVTGEAETQASASKPKLSLCCVFTVFGLIIGQTSFAETITNLQSHALKITL